MKIKISDLMAESGVGFGTSGARGLVKQMTDKICYAYTLAFIKHCEKEYQTKKILAIAGDLRPSTDRILKAVAMASKTASWKLLYCGKIPSPAIAFFGIENKIPTVMVTGSHIPDDRNGIKFNHHLGEITKKDETLIKNTEIELDENLFDSNGFLKETVELPETETSAKTNYENRYKDFFGAKALTGFSLGVYEHSAVGRDIVVSVLESLGAKVTRLARSEKFIPVDTEAIRKEDEALASEWSKLGFHAIVSTDGDSDRPLLADEHGSWLRGDVLGILAAKSLGIHSVATPVSCNSALEKSHFFEKIYRTRIGSPYVIEGMESLKEQGKNIAGYEANGGFLLGTDLTQNGKTLKALATRDALLPIIATLLLSKKEQKTISELLQELPARFSASDRLKEFPTAKSLTKIQEIKTEHAETELFGALSGDFIEANETDGYRMTFASGEIIHLRPSGNAPELRCYVETASKERSETLLKNCLSIMNTWRED